MSYVPVHGHALQIGRTWWGVQWSDRWGVRHFDVFLGWWWVGVEVERMWP